LIPPYHRVVTILEILDTSAEVFWRLSSMVGQLMIRLENNQISEATLSVASASLGELSRACKHLQLRFTSNQIDRIYEHLFGDNRGPVAALRPMLMELHTRILEELSDRFFLSLPPDDIDLYIQKEPPFGIEVASKFPQMSEDISEAGKCLSLGRSTVAVFHLMRVMEIAVQIFGGAIGGVQFASEKNWQNILDETNKKIKSLDQKQQKTKQYAEAASYLYDVKLAWRNEVMHPKQTYTHEEGKAIFAAVGAFLKDLVMLL
jgi:hypothetical protein